MEDLTAPAASKAEGKAQANEMSTTLEPHIAGSRQTNA